jgi:hypothetical protein
MLTLTLVIVEKGDDEVNGNGEEYL